MRRSSAFKIFHLINDTSSTDVPEKVFLVEDELERIRRELSGKLSIIGLVGPTKSIQAYLHQASKSQKEEVTSQSPLQFQGVNFELEQKQVAAIYAVSVAILPQKSQKIQEKIFLCFITSDQFYYSKPISQKSIKYLLIRFIGDLCEHIHILYDKQIQENFNAIGCPYSVQKKKITRIQIVERTQKDIKIKQVPCDFRALYDFDKEYSQKLKLKTTMHTKYALYQIQTLEVQFKKAVLKKLRKDQLKLWEEIFKRQVTDYEKILVSISQPLTKQNIQIIKQCINVYKNLKKDILQFGKQAYSNCMRMLKGDYILPFWLSSKFKENIYFYLIAEGITIIPETYQYKINGISEYDTICKNVAIDICQEANLSGSQKDYKKDLQFMKPIIWQLWLQIKLKVEDYIMQFYDHSDQIKKHKKMQSEQAIDLVIFQLKPQQESKKIIISDHNKIILNQRQLLEKLSVKGNKIMVYLEKAQVYDLKNSQNSKLVSLKLTKNSDNPYSFILLSVNGNDLNIICTYKKTQLIFAFHSQNQTAYLLDTFNQEIIYFKIDSLERIVDQKTKKLTRRNIGITDFGVAINPIQTVFYLQKEKKALYSVQLASGQEHTYDRSNTEQRYLTDPGEPKYQYLRTFNEDLYIVLGNRKVIDVFNPSIDGKLILKHSLKLDETFLGVTVLSEGLNQFMIIFDTNRSRAISFQNMNCNTMLKQQSQATKTFEGNPILDVFFGANEKFGPYKYYVTGSDNQRIKQLCLHHRYHFQQMKQKIQAYLKQLKLERHAHLYQQLQEKQLQYDCQPISAENFLNEIQTRIPIQLCTLQNSNIVPLIKGKLENHHFFKQMTIADRSKVIQFGIVEELLMKEPDKRLLVVSVMGAQSTGKSYLMNRLFGTRFTVSSARTTIGIWLSIYKTQQANYLLMDCEGLFAPYREAKQQEKLIRVLTSISDFTILNQNMSMSNRSLIQLMEGITDSIKNSILKQKSKELYKGEMFIVVRDVKSSEASGIETQFYKSFQSYRKNKSKFIQQLFGGNILLFSLEHFEKKQFDNDIKEIKNKIQQLGLKRPLRTSKSVLESLKVIVNQLTCDDSKNFQEQMIKFQIGKSKDQIIRIWLNGNNSIIQSKIREQPFVVNQKQIVIQVEDFKNQSTSCLQILDLFFKQKIIKNNRLKTTEYYEVYKDYNLFIKKLFQQRFQQVQAKIFSQTQTSLKNCPIQKINSELSDLKTTISRHKQKLQLCMERCSQPSCQLPCTNKFKHKYNIQSEKQTVRVERDSVVKMINDKQKTKEEEQKIHIGLNNISTNLKQELQQQNEMKEQINKFMELERKKDSISEQKNKVIREISNEKKKILQNKMKNSCLLQLIQKTKRLENQNHFLKETQISIFDEAIKYLGEEKIQIYQSQINQNIINGFKQVLKDLKLQKNGIENINIQILQNLRQKRLKKQKCDENINRYVQQLRAKINEQQRKQQQIRSTNKIKLQQYSIFKQKLSQNTVLKSNKQENSKLKIKLQETGIKISNFISQKTKQLSQLQINKLRIEKILENQIFQQDSLGNYVQAQVQRLNLIHSNILNKQLKLAQSEKITNQDIQIIMKQLFEKKIVKQESQINQCVSEIQGYLKKQQLRLKSKKTENHDQCIKQMQQIRKKLQVMQKYKIIREFNKEKQQFYKQMENFKLNLQQHGFGQQWNLLEKLIIQQIPQIKVQQESGTRLESFISKFQCALNQTEQLNNLDINKRKYLIENNKDFFSSKVNQKKLLIQKLIQSLDNCQNEIIQSVQKQITKIQEDISELQQNYGFREKIQSVFFNIIQKQLFNQNFDTFGQQDKINCLFEQFLFINDKIKLHKKQQDQKYCFSGQFNENLYEVAKKMIKIENKMKQQQKKKIVNSDLSYKLLQSSCITQQMFDILKKIIDNLSSSLNGQKQKWKQYKKSQKQLSQKIIEKQEFKQLLSKQLIAQIQRNGFTENWEILFKIISKKSIQISLKQKIERFKYQNSLIYSNLKTQILNVQRTIAQQKIKLKNNQKMENQTQEQSRNIDQDIKLVQKCINQLKANKIDVQQKIKSQTKTLQLLRDGIKKLQQNIADCQQESRKLTNIIEKIQTKLQQNKKIVLKISIINFEENQILIDQWRKQFMQNAKITQNINIIQNNRDLLQKNMSQIEQQQKQLSSNIKQNSMESTTKKIEEINQQIQEIETLKLKIKQLQKLNQQLNILNSRLAQLQNSKKLLCRCLTNHKCQIMCEAGCEDQLCSSGAGHQGEHLCDKPNHKCTNKCEFNQRCQGKCDLKYAHSEDTPHNCNQSHRCNKNCHFCQRLCQKSLFDDHEEHLCENDNRCEKKCLLCDNICSSLHHDHDKKAEIVQIQQEDEDTRMKKIVKRKLHLCDREHNTCKGACCQKGICSFKYKDQQKKWSKNGVQRNYIYTEQIQVVEKCRQKIKPGRYRHEKGECSCKQKHTCDARCPDCRSLCSLIIGHDGNHRAQHRNQQSLIYAAEEQNREIIVRITGEDFVFSVGDISLPTRCQGSCESKGRGHYHLIQCKGGDKCLAKQDKIGAKHSPLKYYPSVEKQYDMVLCRVYWQLYNFRMPVDKKQFDLCDFMCPYNHDDKNTYYCTKKAWHSFSSKCTDHTFECAKVHQPLQFDSIEVCFLMDVSASMGRFIDQCKNTVKEIIQRSSSSKKKLNIQFAIVGYRDHQMYKSNISMALRKLCKQKKQKLESLPETQILKQKMEETNFIQQLQKLKKKYEQKRGSQNIRKQFNEKQLLMLDYHYPFYLDLASSQDMVSVVRLISLLSPLNLLFALLAGGKSNSIADKQQKTFKKLLLDDIDLSYKQLVEQQQTQIAKKQQWKLLEVNHFTDANSTIKFLDNLQADGGGDPPEAVLDGMEAACNLKWSKNQTTLKYILHIFDAPPHGRQYAQDNGDRFPDGCPCGKTHEPIIEKINKIPNLKYFVYPLTDRVNRTLDLFELCGLKFEKKRFDKDKPQDLGAHMTELICRSIERKQLMISRQ